MSKASDTASESLAAEFERACQRYESSTAEMRYDHRDIEAFRSREAWLLEIRHIAVDNRDAIFRALRLAHLIENPSCALLDDLRKAIGCETHAEPRAVLAALREAVR